MKKYKFFLKYINENRLLFFTSNFLSVLSAIFGGLTIGIIIPLLEPDTEGIFSDLNVTFFDRLDNFLTYLNSFSGDSKIRIICLIIVIFSLFEFITMYLTYLISSIIQIKTLENMQTTLINKIKKINLLTFASFEQGKLFAMVVQESKVLSRVLARVVNGIRDIWLLIIFSSALVVVSPVMALSGLFLLGAFTNIVNGRLGTRLKKGEKSFVESTEVIFGELDETLKSFKSIKASGHEDKHFSRMLEQFKMWRANEWEVIKISILPQPVLTLLNSLSIAALLLIGTFLFPDNKNDWLGLMVPFFLFIFRLLPTINSLNTLRIKLKGMSPYIDRFNHFDLVSKDNEEFNGTKSIESIKTNIEIRDLSFKFSNTDAFSLDKVNLKLEKSEMTAIVGPSGSGKTTLVNLLLGLMTQTEGVILIDGINLSELDINQYRKTISYVDQETFFFNRTIMENLKWIEEDANEEEILEAVKLANATEFIKDFEEGFDTKLGAAGKNLSGGQKQRLAIARALLNESDFIILDESTSNLDYETELLVYKGVEKMLKEKGVIVIAHRYSTIKNADKIIYMESGKVLEVGNHDELISKKGNYFKQFTSGGLTI
tara:strand:- start:1502 stop:3301 length:1800 start_codon:yes stop_codon:yes gene_type:complete